MRRPFILSFITPNTITVYQAPQADDSRDREPFLDKLQRRYHDLLQQSLRQVEPIPLEMQDEPTATDKISNSSKSTQKKETLSATTSLQPIFEQAGGELLLLGNPGAGKSTLLFTFAMDLYEQARNDPSCRLPVILNLATWANKQQPLHEWLVQETARLYNNFPRSPIKKWLQSGSFLLLLDGLNEVPASVRGACIEVINPFRGQHSEHFQPMIVCCRHKEYFEQKERLIFQHAIKVQPLREQQVKHYLTDVGKPLEGIRKLLRNDAELRQIVGTPLMLHILTLAYQDVSVRTLPKKGSPEEQKHYIFDQYFHRMLREHPELPSLSDVQVQQWKHWLAYIAQQMRDHNQETFLVEDIASSWLPNRYRLLYQWGGGSIRGLVFGLLVQLVSGEGDGKGNDKQKLLLIEAITWSWRRASFKLGSGLGSGLFTRLLFGLEAFLQHFTLRFLLWRLNYIPWDIVAFLNQASHRILLYRDGRGYRFIHILFRDYVASLEEVGLGSLQKSIISP